MQSLTERFPEYVSFAGLLASMDAEDKNHVAEPTLPIATSQDQLASCSQQQSVSPHTPPQKEETSTDDEWLSELLRVPETIASCSSDSINHHEQFAPTLAEAACELEESQRSEHIAATTFAVSSRAPAEGRDLPFLWSLPRERSSASTIMSHAHAIVDTLTGQQGKPTVFKIGVTKDPKHRWTNRSYGYSHDKHTVWDKMIILAKVEDKLAAGLLEAYLINAFKCRQGCRNEAPGGEGLSPPGPYFVYVVFKRLYSLCS